MNVTVNWTRVSIVIGILVAYTMFCGGSRSPDCSPLTYLKLFKSSGQVESTS